MLRITLLISSLLSLIGCTEQETNQPESAPRIDGIFQSDDRAQADPSEPVYPFIGQLISQMEDKEYHRCGATLLANNMLVTSASCFLTRDGKTVHAAEAASFFPLKDNKHRQIQYPVRQIWLSHRYIKSILQPEKTDAAPLHNIALVTLKPIGKDPDTGKVYGWAGYSAGRDYIPQATLVSYGFQQDKPRDSLWKSICTEKVRSGRDHIKFTCDGLAGIIGGPVFITSLADKYPRVLGVNLGFLGDEEGRNEFYRLPEALHEVIEQYRAGNTKATSPLFNTRTSFRQLAEFREGTLQANLFDGLSRSAE